MTNINKYGVGKLKEARLPNGNIVKREDLLTVLQGEVVGIVTQVNDDDHFLYQAHKVYTLNEVREKFGGLLPLQYQGPAIMCTCGSDGVYFTEGPLLNKAICRHFMMFTRHQTSETIQDNKLILSKDSKKWLDDSSKIDFEKQERVVRKY